MPIPTQGYISIDNQLIAFNVLQNFEDNGFSVDNDGYALYNGKRFYYNGTLVLGNDEPLDGGYYWTIIDLTGYTWVANDQLTSQLNNQYNISFISNNNNFTYIKSATVIISGETMHILYYNEQPIYSYNDIQWANNTYKTIQITGGTDATNQALIAWLEANGTLTAPQPTPSITDLTNTTWLFNSTGCVGAGNNDETVAFNINFTYENTSASTLYAPFYDRQTRMNTINFNFYIYITDDDYTAEAFHLHDEGWYLVTLDNNNVPTFTLMSEPPVITITGGTDATNAELIAWLEANATQVTSANNYNLSYNLTNLTNGNVSLTFVADTGYALPSTITVSNGTLVSYDNTTGIAVISGDDTTVVSGECVAQPSGYEIVVNITLPSAETAMWRNSYSYEGWVDFNNGNSFTTLTETLHNVTESNDFTIQIGKLPAEGTSIVTGDISQTSTNWGLNMTHSYTITGNGTITINIPEWD